MWHAILSLGIGIFLILGLINFVYIDVYGSFVPIKAAGGNLATMLETAKEFYVGVPVSLYLLTLLYFVITIGITWWYRRQSSLECSVSFCATSIETPQHTKHIFQFVYMLVAVCILFGSIFLADYIQKNPRDGWWKDNYLVSDLGIPGYTFIMIQEIFVPHQIKNDAAYAHTVDTLEEISKNLPQSSDIVSSTMTKDPWPQSPYDFLQFYLKKLEHGFATHTDEIDIPDFSLKAPHILVYQLESIGSWAIDNDPSPMPYFKQLMQDTIHTQKFFANGCHTIDAEFVTLCGFFPDPSAAIADVGSEIQYNQCITDLLEREKGYTSAVFHVNDAQFWNRHILDSKWGFDNLFFAPNYFPDEKLDDFIPLGKAIDYIKQSDSPVFAQVISMVSHTYHTEADLQKIERLSKVKIPRFEGTIDPELLARNIDLREETMRIYFAYLQAVDNDIKFLFDNLETEGLLDNTIVVIVNDHRFYNFSKNDTANFYLYNEIPFMMYVPGMTGLEVRDIASHIDIAPSLLELVLGKEYRKPVNFMGTSLFSKKHPNLALSSCNEQIQYVNPYEIIIGNRIANEYVSLDADTEISAFELEKIGNAAQTITSIVKNMIRSNLLVQE